MNDLLGSTPQAFVTFAFMLKHALGDFVFQTSSMVIGKGSPDWGFVIPLAKHCGVHAGLTFLVILVLVGSQWWWLSIVDFVIHFIIDRLKSGPKYAGRFKMDLHPSQFWACFGFDQFLHQATYLGFILVMFQIV